MSNEPEKVEYRVLEVPTYVIQRYEEDADGGSGSAAKGEYRNAEVAIEVAEALCKAEHERLGWPLGDMRIIYPNLMRRTEDGLEAIPMPPAGVRISG